MSRKEGGKQLRQPESGNLGGKQLSAKSIHDSIRKSSSGDAYESESNGDEGKDYGDKSPSVNSDEGSDDGDNNNKSTLHTTGKDFILDEASCRERDGHEDKDHVPTEEPNELMESFL